MRRLTSAAFAAICRAHGGNPMLCEATFKNKKVFMMPPCGDCRMNSDPGSDATARRSGSAGPEDRESGSENALEWRLCSRKQGCLWLQPQQKPNTANADKRFLPIRMESSPSARRSSA